VVDGFNAAIALTASGQPTGVTVTFNPTSIAARGPQLDHCSMGSGCDGTRDGTYTITITGTGGGITQKDYGRSDGDCGGGPDFSISASPTAISV